MASGVYFYRRRGEINKKVGERREETVENSVVDYSDVFEYILRVLNGAIEKGTIIQTRKFLMEAEDAR
jgi:hypothetical protein